MVDLGKRRNSKQTYVQGTVMVIWKTGKGQVLVYSIDTRLYSVTLAINILYEGANVALFVGVYVQKNKVARGDFL